MVIAPSPLALEDDCASRGENQMTNDHAELPEQQCVSWEANEGSLGLACLYLSTVTFPEQACDSQSTSTSIRSGSTEKQSHTISAHCVSGSPIRMMLFPDCVSRQQPRLSFTYACASPRPQRETWFYRAPALQLEEDLKQSAGSSRAVSPSILIAPALIFPHCCGTSVI